MAPDGSFIIFASNRPNHAAESSLDGHYNGSRPYSGVCEGTAVDGTFTARLTGRTPSLVQAWVTSVPSRQTWHIRR